MSLVDPYEGFCFYCAEDFVTLAALRRHLRKEHLGTYAQLDLAP